MGLIPDANFIITAERTKRSGVWGPTDAFLGANDGETFYATFTVAGELACGSSVARWEEWRRLLEPLNILPWKIEIAWQYGELLRYLRRRGTPIGVNDLWIAATAPVSRMGLVTNDVRAFQRIPGAGGNPILIF